ncbi:MAG: hypothetical protein JSU87_11560 [Gemmatimonadota bacterium]|nr:MAG: hypothetical protein JSU87_11560 [Gemmatimonadota bacterium]
MPAHNRYKNRIAFPVAIVSFFTLALLAACAKQPPTLLDNLDNPGMSREQLRVELYNFVSRFTAELEKATYLMASTSQDLRLTRRSLLWVTSAVPAVQTAAFQFDPAAGLIDVWALCVQQWNYFESGPGSAEFDEHQDLARAASRRTLDDIEAIATRVASGAEYDTVRTKVYRWAADNPLENILFARVSTAPLTTAALGGQPSGIFSSVGNMADEIRDLSARLSIYAELLPKQTRWQAALLLSAEAGDLSLLETMRNIERHAGGIENIAAFLDSTKAFLDTMPVLVSSQRQAVMADIARERITVMQEVDSLLALTLQAIAAERAAVMADITQERIATLQELDAIATRLTGLAVENAMDRVNTAIDHFYWRAVQLLAGLIMLIAAAGYLGLRYFTARTSASRA